VSGAGLCLFTLNPEGEPAGIWNPGNALLKSHQFGGRLAQLGERIVRNDEAGGSNPLPSTKFLFSLNKLDSLSKFEQLPKLPN
jgi:hypothetical protein